MEQRVLIIDSDKVIKYALDEYGIGACYTLSVVDGIERLLRQNYQLVILNISLSETEGLQLIRFMRQMKDMPILALSSQGGIESRERAYQMGEDDFMGKPLELRASSCYGAPRTGRSRWPPGQLPPQLKALGFVHHTKRGKQTGGSRRPILDYRGTNRAILCTSAEYGSVLIFLSLANTSSTWMLASPTTSIYSSLPAVATGGTLYIFPQPTERICRITWVTCWPPTGTVGR